MPVLPAGERFRIESALSASEAHYRLIFDRHPCPMWVFDVETLEILAVNDAAVRRYGYTRDEFLAMTVRELRPRDELPAFDRSHLLMLDGHDVHGVFRHQRKDGSIMDVEIRTTALPLRGGRLRLVQAHDMTERRRVEDSLRFLDNATGILTASLDPVVVCRNLAHLTVPRLADWCVVHRPDEEGRLWPCEMSHANPFQQPLLKEVVERRVAWPAEHPLRTAFREGATQLAGRGAARTVLPGARDDLQHQWVAGVLDATAAAYVPLTSPRGSLAVLECVSTGARDHYDAAEVALLEELAQRAAQALDNALLYERALAAGHAAPAVGEEAADLLDRVTDGFVSVDRAWRITFVNRAAELLLRRPRVELMGRVLWELHDEAESPFRREYRRALTEQRPVAFEAPHEALGVRLEVRAYPSPTGLSIYLRDVTTEHASAAERRAQEQQLRHFLESAAELVHVGTADGRIVYANRQWREAVGIENPAGLALLELVAPEHRERMREAQAGALAGSPVRELEFDVITASGDRATLRGDISAITVGGVPVTTRGVFENVTELRRLGRDLQRAREAADAAVRAKSDFLARMSHELRTPLTAVVGFAHLLLEDSPSLGTAERSFVERILAAAEQLVHLIDDVLDLTKIEAGRMALVIAPADVGALVRDVVAGSAAQHASQDVHVLVDVPESMATLDTDAVKLRQVLLALVDNALKFTQSGTVTITVAVDPATRQPVSVEVRDTGIGISPLQQRSIFSAFEQGDGTVTRLHAGTGLGLAIARALCDLLGYRLSVQSAPGVGSTFTLELRSVAPPTPALDAGSLASPAPAPGGAVAEPELVATLRTLIDASPLAIVVYDVGWSVRLWNAAAARIFGWRPEEVLGRPVPVIPPDGDADFRRIIRSVVERGAVTEVPAKRRRKDGRIIDVNISIAVLRSGDGRLRGFVSMIADATGQRQLEEQLRQAQKMEAVGRLAGGIAHDFNNILTVITLHTDLLLVELPPGDPRRADVEEVRDAAARASALTRQLLVFTRKQVSQRRVVDVSSVVGNLEKMLRRLIGSHIELAIIRGTAPCLVLADPGQLEQVVMNLVLNARDAMPQGGALVVETSHAVLDGAPEVSEDAVPPGDYVLLCVTDTGVGMDAATRARIFEPFFTTKEPGKGTGLGLATVYGIVTESGGHVRVRSEPGAGTTFRIYLPRSEAQEDDAADDAADAARQGTETILLVEDQEAVRTVAERILRARGYHVLHARHGMDALDVAERHAGPIDLVLTDLVMPEMHGHEMAERLRARRRGVRVVFMSGYTDDVMLGELRREAVGRGEHFLAKPFTADELTRVVRAALDASRS